MSKLTFFFYQLKKKDCNENFYELEKNLSEEFFNFDKKQVFCELNEIIEKNQNFILKEKTLEKLYEKIQNMMQKKSEENKKLFNNKINEYEQRAEALNKIIVFFLNC